MDNFNAIFNGVKKDKMSKFYKNVRTLTSVRRNKTEYSHNLINLIHLYSKLYKKSTPKNVTTKLLNKHFTMKDYRELFGNFRRSLVGGRTQKQKISNLFALGKKTHALQRYFLDFDNPNGVGFDLDAMPKISYFSDPRTTQMKVDADLVTQYLDKGQQNLHNVSFSMSNWNLSDSDVQSSGKKRAKGRKYNRGKQAVSLAKKGKRKQKEKIVAPPSDSNDQTDSDMHILDPYEQSGFSWVQAPNNNRNNNQNNRNNNQNDMVIVD